MNDTTKVPSISLEGAPQAQQAAVEAGYLRANSLLTWWAALAFATIIGFSRISYGLLLPSLRADLPGSFSAYGLVGTMNLVGYLIGIVAMPVLLHWYRNRVRLSTLALLLLNLFMGLSALSFTLPQLVIWRTLIGLFSAPATVLALAVALEHVQPRQRGLASALVWMGGSIGVLISGLIAPFTQSLDSHWSWRIVWAAMGLIGLIVTYGYHRELVKVAQMVLPQRPSTPLAQGEPHGPLSILAEVFAPGKLLWLTLSYFAIGFGYIIYVYYFPSLVAQQGLSPLLVGLIWAFLGAVAIIASPIWGKFMDRWPTGWLLAVNLGLGAIGAVAVLTKLPVAEFIGTVLFGATAFAASPAIVSFLLRRAVSDERYASSFSILTTLFAIGQALGPVVGGMVADHQGLPLGAATSALIIGIGALFAIGYGIMQRRAPTLAQPS